MSTIDAIIDAIEARADAATAPFRLYQDGSTSGSQQRSWWVCPCRQHTRVADTAAQFTCEKCGRTWQWWTEGWA